MKALSIYAILLLFTVSLPAQEDVSVSEYQQSALKIDGKANDWANPFHFYDPELTMRFDIKNSDSSLYLLFMTNDPMKIQKLFMAGWEIHLSTKDKNKKFSAKIIIPKVNFQEEPDALAMTGVRGPNDFNIMVSKYRLQLAGIRAAGFKTKNGDLPLADPTGINIGISPDSIQNLCYEISVPLKELISSDLINLNETLQMNIIINAYKSDKKKEDGNISDSKMYAGKYGYVNNPAYYYANMGGYGGETNDFFTQNRYKMKFSLSNK